MLRWELVIAYLDPGSGDGGFSAALLVLGVLVALVLLGVTIYVAVRLARRD